MQTSSRRAAECNESQHFADSPPHYLSAQIFHAALLLSMDVPTLESSGQRAMAQVAKHSAADALAANLSLAVVLPRIKGARQLKVEHMTHDLAAHILHV